MATKRRLRVLRHPSSRSTSKLTETTSDTDRSTETADESDLVLDLRVYAPWLDGEVIDADDLFIGSIENLDLLADLCREERSLILGQVIAWCARLLLPEDTAPVEESETSGT